MAKASISSALKNNLWITLTAVLHACGSTAHRPSLLDNDQDAGVGNGTAKADDPICGNVVVETGEDCDDGSNNSDTEPDACRADCTLPRCGDGVVDSDEACEGDATSECSTSCGATGTATCTDECAWSRCSPPDETCNGEDDDCDAEVDEVFDCLLGAIAECETACGSTGTWTCENGCTWSACMPPAEEPCNEADDDCDGDVDEGDNACGGGCTLDAEPLAPCDGGDADLCAEGTWTCDGLNAVICRDATGDNIEICDGIDNDCNDATDEGDNPCGGVCALAGVPGEPCDGDDLDLCAEGLWLCAGPNAVTCTDPNDADPEVCDGIDNDCDSATDEGDSPCGGACLLDAVPGVPCDADDSDFCQEGVWTCEGLNAVACTDATDDSVDLCDGEDNDCDGEVDEEFALDVPCDGPDADECIEGLTVCTADGRGTTCGDLTDNTDEICNGSDDDCDGRTDEGFGCRLGNVRACFSACGTTGTQACEAGCTWGACVPRNETCNGEDDDCDTFLDNGFACVQGTSGIECDTACGTVGTGICGADCTVASCTPPAEQCNGIDDDCDDEIDEGSCDDVNPCTDDVCRPDLTCRSTPDDTNGCAGVCNAGSCNSITTLFSDGFEGGANNWSLGSLWFRVSSAAHSGIFSARGSWSGFCPAGGESSRAAMNLDVDLTFAESATIEFWYWATLGFNDTLRVQASTNGGASWSTGTLLSGTSNWRFQSMSLVNYLGQRVRLAFRIYNACGDCCGAQAWIDDVVIRATWPE